MPDYRTMPVEPFDKWFVLVSLGLIALHGAIFIPLLGDAIFSVFPFVKEILAQFHHSIALQPDGLRMVEFILLADFLGYWAHRSMHSGRGWPFHAMHHSPKSVNWLSGVRGTPVHFIVILTPTVFSSHLFLYEAGFIPLFVFMCFDVLNQQLSHSNVRLPYVKRLEYVFVTPRMHFVHHHPDMRYNNSNFGLYFTFWDRLFGTYTDADDVVDNRKGMLGIGYAESNWSLFWGLQRRSQSVVMEAETQGKVRNEE
jgi:sterol desaturase/sphingolipid hydroxylase (fatty acid hydroxylase superfamily)